MTETIELTKSDVVRLFVPTDPQRIPPDPEAFIHWLHDVFEVVVVTGLPYLTTRAKTANMKAATAGYNQNVTGAVIATRSPDAILATNPADIATFVDDFCGTPPKVTLPWPVVIIVVVPQPPPPPPDPIDQVRVIDLFQVGAQFQLAANGLAEHPGLAPDLQQALAAGADRLFSEAQLRLKSSIR